MWHVTQHIVVRLRYLSIFSQFARKDDWPNRIQQLFISHSKKTHKMNSLLKLRKRNSFDSSDIVDCFTRFIPVRTLIGYISSFEGTIGLS